VGIFLIGQDHQDIWLLGHNFLLRIVIVKWFGSGSM
jgi:hypothetical protein